MPAPNGLDLSTYSEGEEFELPVTFTIDANGGLYATAIDGMMIEEAQEEPVEEAQAVEGGEQEPMSFQQAVEAGMSTQQR